MNIDKDAFSNGQILSKLWLCEELEKLFDKIDSIWIYGGWYGLTAFLLQSRNNIDIQNIRSIDVDPHCEPVADMINENWVFQDWQFKAITADCNLVMPTLGDPDLIINTSTEHFDNSDWWDNIPEGMIVALQSNDMKHDDHCSTFQTLDEFSAAFSLSNVLFAGSKQFKYPTWKFTRFMVIGQK